MAAFDGIGFLKICKFLLLSFAIKNVFFHCVYFQNPFVNFIIKVNLFFSFEKFLNVLIENVKRKKDKKKLEQF